MTQETKNTILKIGIVVFAAYMAAAVVGGISV